MLAGCSELLMVPFCGRLSRNTMPCLQSRYTGWKIHFWRRCQISWKAACDVRATVPVCRLCIWPSIVTASLAAIVGLCTHQSSCTPALRERPQRPPHSPSRCLQAPLLPAPREGAPQVSGRHAGGGATGEQQTRGCMPPGRWFPPAARQWGVEGGSVIATTSPRGQGPCSQSAGLWRQSPGTGRPGGNSGPTKHRYASRDLQGMRYGRRHAL
jgi:hypothetical protein